MISAHLLGDDAVKDALAGFFGTDNAGAWLAHTSTIPQNFTLTHLYNMCIFT